MIYVDINRLAFNSPIVDWCNKNLGYCTLKILPLKMGRLSKTKVRFTFNTEEDKFKFILKWGEETMAWC